MPCFELLRQHFAMCGIEALQGSSKTHPFNAKNLTIFLLICANVTLIGILLREATAFDEIVDISFRGGSDATCGIVYVIIVWETSALFEFVDDLADTVETSEY